MILEYCSIVADVYIFMYGRKQHNMDEHSRFGDMYKEFS